MTDPDPNLPPDDDDEAPEQPSADDVLDQLEAGGDNYGALRALSDIGDGQLARLMGLWPQFEPERRRELLAKLDQLANEEALLDFHRVHLSALHDSDVATRILAVRGIAIEERPDYLRLLCHQLEHDEAASVRAEIADVLGKWVVSMEFGLLADEDAEELTVSLTNRIHDEEEEDEVRARCLEALGASSEETVGELIGETYELGSHRMRVAALKAMGRSASETWLQILIFNFDDDDADIRAAAATAAGTLLVDDAVTPLGMLLEDREIEVQLAAIAALGEIGGEEAERILTRLQRESLTPEVRDAAQDSLAQSQLLSVPLRDDGSEEPDFSDGESDDAGF
ncbi:MAG: HEAT repeat domain-containing protein [Chloroflexi bacterium]|nr:HEAT repeat domain-containing protein [Chloroflexota bacterium]MDA1148088.1 HEAT repeat domain-containing protein [Chloroflexota bacterium]